LEPTFFAPAGAIVVVLVEAAAIARLLSGIL
jgi:hypothetical protein